MVGERAFDDSLRWLISDLLHTLGHRVLNLLRHRTDHFIETIFLYVVVVCLLGHLRVDEVHEVTSDLSLLQLQLVENLAFLLLFASQIHAFLLFAKVAKELVLLHHRWNNI